MDERIMIRTEEHQTDMMKQTYSSSKPAKFGVRGKLKISAQHKQSRNDMGKKEQAAKVKGNREGSNHELIVRCLKGN